MVRRMLFGSALVLCTGGLQANVLVVNEDNDRREMQSVCQSRKETPCFGFVCLGRK